jgi:hypothetical protein
VHHFDAKDGAMLPFEKIIYFKTHMQHQKIQGKDKLEENTRKVMQHLSHNLTTKFKGVCYKIDAHMQHQKNS